MELLKLVSTLKGEELGFCQGVKVTDFFLLVDASTVPDKTLLRKLADIINVRVYNLSGFGAQVTLTRLAPEGKAIVLLPSDTLAKMRKASNDAPSTVITIRDTEFLVVFDYNAKIEAGKTESQEEVTGTLQATEPVTQSKKARARVSIDNLAETIANRAGFKAANDLLAEYRQQHLDEVEDTKPKNKVPAQRKVGKKQAMANVSTETKSQEEDLELRLHFLQGAKNDNSNNEGAEDSLTSHAPHDAQKMNSTDSSSSYDASGHNQTEDSNTPSLEEVEREILSQSLAAQADKPGAQLNKPTMTKEQMAELKKQLKEERNKQAAEAKKALEKQKARKKRSSAQENQEPEAGASESVKESAETHSASEENLLVTVTLEGPDGPEAVNVTKAFDDRLAKWKSSYPSVPIVVMEIATMEAIKRQEYEKIEISYNEDMNFIKVGDKI